MHTRIRVLQTDITTLAVDAIVNPADHSLLPCCGINKQIHHAAGPALTEACKQLGGCATGEAKLTSGFSLPARYIIHTVGPLWRGGAKGELRQLAACHENSLKLALDYHLKTIAFPPISCGTCGFPLPSAAAIALKETANFLELHPAIESVSFVCHDASTFDTYCQVAETLSFSSEFA